MPRQMITYADFRGGLNTESANDILADNELVVATNVDLTERGALTKRAGLTKVNATAFSPVEDVCALYCWRNSLGEDIVAVVDGKDGSKSRADIYLIPWGRSGSPVLVSTLIDYSYHLYPRNTTVLSYKDYALIFSGWAWGVYRDDHGDPHLCGLHPGSCDKPTLTAGASGSRFPAGTYRALVTLVNGVGGESIPNTSIYASVTLTESADSIAWSNIPTQATTEPHYPVVGKRLYRTEKNGSVFKYVASIGTATTTYTDKVADASLGAALETDKQFLQGVQSACFHPSSQRLFAMRYDGQVIYSEPGRLDYWKTTSVLYPNEKAGAPRGVAAFADAVLAFYHDGIWAWRGMDTTDAHWQKLATSGGSGSVKTVALTPESLTFWGVDGINSISTAALASNMVIEPGKEMVANRSIGKVALPTVPNVWDNWSTAVWDSRLRRYVCHLTNYGFDTNMLVYHWDAGAFTSYALPVAINSLCATLGSDILVGSDNGFIYKLNPASYSDDGTAIPVTIKTKGWDMGIPTWKWVSKLFASFGSYDSEQSTINMKVDTGYSNLTVPEFIWSTPKGQLKQESIACHMKGSKFQIEITHNKADEPFALYSVGFVFQPLMPRGL